MNKSFDLAFGSRRSSKVDQQGHTMLVALFLLTVIATLATLSVSRTAATARFGGRATDYARTERGADGLIEYAYGVWKAAIVQKDQPLNVSEANALTTTGVPTF